MFRPAEKALLALTARHWLKYSVGIQSHFIESESWNKKATSHDTTNNGTFPHN